jgi:hypothetical protein
MKTKQPAERFLVLTGFNYGRDNKRHEVGEIVPLPAGVAAALLACEPPAVTRDLTTIPGAERLQKERAK